jgi:hypothetical protein
LAGPSKAKSPWNIARYSYKATGKEDDHNNNATYPDVSRLHRSWADTSLQCWWHCGCDKGGNASATRVKKPVQHGQRCQRKASNKDSTMLAMTPAQHGQDASTMLAKMPALKWKAKSLGNSASYGNKNHRQ